MIKTCTYCDKFAYTTYRDQNWVEYKLCIDHIIILKEKSNIKSRVL